MPDTVDWIPWQRAFADQPPLPNRLDGLLDRLLGGHNRLVVASAHPDDETLGAGQLIAAASRPVRALTLSAGEHCVDDPRVDPTDLGVIRLGEWRGALGELGATPVDSPRWPDGRLSEHEDRLADTLAGELDADTVLLATWRHDPHPDHAAVGRAAAAAVALTGARLLEYPVWGPLWMTPDEVAETGCRLVRVELDERTRACRLRASRHYVSQLEGLFPGWDAVVPEELLLRHDRQLLAVEVDR